jgi:DNA-directed RNA polymerase sigma subunit (sigma70/sigma32)
LGAGGDRLYGRHGRGIRRGGAVINETEAKVIKMRFGLDGMVEHTLQQVADAIGVTKQRAHQIEQAALKKMSSSEKLRSFWGNYGGD